MDVNGTRFHLLTGRDDWEPRLELRGATGLWWDRERVGLSLLPKVLRFPRRTSEALLTRADRRGAGRDSYGNTYWIGRTADRLRIIPADGLTAGDYWCVEQLRSTCAIAAKSGGEFAPAAGDAVPVLPRLSGLAVTREHYLVVGTLEPGGLLVFDLHGGGPPSWKRWPPGIPFHPFDLAPAPDGGIWVLDRTPAPSATRLWRLDRYFRVVALTGEQHELDLPADDFRPLTGTVKTRGSRHFPTGLALQAGSPVALHDPIAVEGLPDDSVLVLGASPDGQYSVVQRYRAGRMENEEELNGGILEQVLADPRIKAHDFAFLLPEATAAHPDEVKGELVLVLEDGNQAVAFGLEAFRADLSLIIRPRYLPLRRYTGKALVVGQDAVYYDLEERWYPLTEQPRRRYESKAQVDGLVFDGKEPGCVWHRVVIDACIPEGTQVQVSTRAADERALLEDEDWQLEPAPYRRGDGAEIVLHRPFGEHERSLPGTGTSELLLQAARGRYIELRLRLAGDGRVTPRIRALRLYYPRFSYLEKFLPAVYREEPHSARFLDRYLANVEGTFSLLEDRIARAESLLDSRTVPAEFLDWLAGWLGAVLDEDWGEARRRLFIDHAELLFRWRGTQLGMRAAIRLAIESCPDASIFDELRDQRGYSPGGLGGRNVRIVERYLYRQLPGVLIGDPTDARGLSMLDPTGLDALSDPEEINRRYRNFLRWRYAIRAEEDQDPLAALNDVWGTQLSSFNEVFFVRDEPDGDEASQPLENPAQLADRARFFRCELANAGVWGQRDPEELNRRYRDYLRRRYAERAGESQDPLEVLNTEWGTAFSDFEEVFFAGTERGESGLFRPVAEVPEDPAQRPDWLRFAQRELAISRVWRPEYGAYALHVRYQEALRRRYVVAHGESDALVMLNERWGRDYARFEDIRFSPTIPENSLAAEDWLHFVRNEIGFTYAPVTEEDTAMYREFLARRHRRIEVLNREYARGAASWPNFQAVGLPAEDRFPQAGRELFDWIQFVSLMLPIRRNAHRFTVLVPTEPGELPDSRARRIAQVEEIVRREKPAHTDFEVKLFWALFQVGTARLGEDSVVGDGARYVAIVLGGTYLSQGLLAHSQPFSETNRRVVGRDPLP